MRKSKTQQDLELLEEGVIPQSMEWRLPEEGVVFFEPDKVNYNLNTPSFWYSKWDANLLEQFPCLNNFVNLVIDEMMNSNKTPLDEILERQNNNNDILYEDGVKLIITEKTEATNALQGIKDRLYS